MPKEQIKERLQELVQKACEIESPETVSACLFNPPQKRPTLTNKASKALICQLHALLHWKEKNPFRSEAIDGAILLGLEPNTSILLRATYKIPVKLESNGWAWKTTASYKQDLGLTQERCQEIVTVKLNEIIKKQNENTQLITDELISQISHAVPTNIIESFLEKGSLPLGYKTTDSDYIALVRLYAFCHWKLPHRFKDTRAEFAENNGILTEIKFFEKKENIIDGKVRIEQEKYFHLPFVSQKVCKKAIYASLNTGEEQEKKQKNVLCNNSPRHCKSPRTSHGSPTRVYDIHGFLGSRNNQGHAEASRSPANTHHTHSVNRYRVFKPLTEQEIARYKQLLLQQTKPSTLSTPPIAGLRSQPR